MSPRRNHPASRARCSDCGHVHAGQHMGGVCLDCDCKHRGGAR
ncbi:hypothetical protein QOZ88_05805 [Blastococcus sp. BMG 814]|uniref:Uncharacterized protein n=1 Tax=Blastococcus carthaginiensis TaxID=3050034 RepID=A0ABT9I9A1_9ACTN|nr:hypothetical protein [Blastococcus carthaginiensis]MDP5182144.1 hypothetical protein [Blastococcus carthaginiensis]